MKRAENIRELQHALKSIWDTQRFSMLVLFGSFSKGKMKPDSDLDIGYMAYKPIDETELTNDIIQTSHWNDVDVVNLSRANPVLSMQIAKSGKVLYSIDPSIFSEFRSLTFRKYIDSEKLRAAQRHALDRFEGKK